MNLFFSDLLTRDGIISLLLTLPVILITLSLHEMAHGFVAYKLGDPTARNLGRLTMNPLKHIDPIGFIAMLLIGFGWAKPVPIDPRYFKKPRSGMAWVALAGPLSNLLLGFVCAGLWLGALILHGKWTLLPDNVFIVLSRFLSYFVVYNTFLCIFNLIPVPPLDGSKILYRFLPYRWIYKFLPYEKYVQLGLIVLLLFSDSLFGQSFLTYPAYFVMDAMTDFWQWVLL